MRVAEVSFTGISPYSPRKHITAPKLEKESPDAYERRTWREGMHYDKDGMVFIPPMQLKLSVDNAANFLGAKIPGRGNSMYKKHFVAGVMVFDPIPLGIHKDDVPPNELFVPSDGRKGGSSRVTKLFPLINDWGGTASFYIFDDTITKSVFEEHIREAGKFIGIGTFRPQNGGYYGRFRVDDVKWMDKLE